MIEAAAQSFLAARQRYREKKKLSQRLSRSSSGKSLDRNSLAGVEEEVRRRICSRHSGRELQLDDTECEQLSTVFAAMPDKYHLFEACLRPMPMPEVDPQIALTFGMANIAEIELRRKTPFRYSVQKRGREEELVQIIRMVGRQHCQVKQLSFTAARWLSFKSALTWTFSRGEQKDKLHVQWSLLISFLICEIKDAYLAHIRTLRSNSLPHIVETYRLEFHRRKKSQTQLGPLHALPPPAAPSDKRNGQQNEGKASGGGATALRL
uniref:Uncharacterized protein n=1 Tax=Globodera pallida TaxID=36090 RepID=A0A183BTK8_GLOPA